PDFITPGMQLFLPSDARPEAPVETAGTVVVEPGDTLSQIALEELGDAGRYPEIFEASNDMVQPDGARLTDPDLLRPGWELTLPGSTMPGEADAAAMTGPPPSSGPEPPEPAAAAPAHGAPPPAPKAQPSTPAPSASPPAPAPTTPSQ